MPSENEALALVTYEAMAMATPIFFTDVGAESELLEREQLVDQAMPVAPALADRIWPYLLDAEKRRILGAGQRARVVRDHAIDESFERLVALYERILHSGSSVADLRVAVRNDAPSTPLPARTAVGSPGPRK